MRRLTPVLLGLLLAACTAVDTDRSSTSTTTPKAATTTVPRTATSPTQAPTTTLAHDQADDGSESIGVTDRVTIVITDPEDR